MRFHILCGAADLKHPSLNTGLLRMLQFFASKGINEECRRSRCLCSNEIHTADYVE